MRRSWQKRAARESPISVGIKNRRPARCAAAIMSPAGGRLMRRLVAVGFVLAMVAPARAQRPLISTNPETPFKLATFQADGRTRLGLVLGTRILDIEAAHTAVVQELALRGTPAMPRDMRTLIEDYDRLAPHLYRIANRFKEPGSDNPQFAFRVDRVAILAPIKYPYNLLAIARNDNSHAGRSVTPGRP